MRVLTVLTLTFLSVCTVAFGQTAQINGTIRDATGLAIPGAAVKATQTATGVVRNTVSGADGSYVLPNLPVGPYLVEVTKDGFTKYAQTGIVLQVDTNPTVDVAMRVGAVSEQVTVEAGAAQVETRTTSIGQVVDSQRVLEMPLNGREVHELIFLAGMANYPGTASLNTVRNYPTVVVSVAGGAPDSVSYSLDGLIHQDPYNNLSLPLPFPDALQEFKVETSAIPAQYGYHSTATVNAVTKSGTNEFHGDLFEFLRNGDLNANDFFNNSARPYKPRDTLKRNQYGGTIGGPIRKDKLFFFGGYQRTSLRSDGTSTTAFIPTPATLTGDFSELASPQCNNGVPKNLLSSAGFTNNQISPTLLDPVAVNILKTIPGTPGPCGRTNYGQVANQDEDLVASKVDYTINARQSMFGRFYYAKLNQSSTYDGKNPLSIASYGFNDLDFGLALGHTFVITPTVVNSLHLGANRTNIAKIPDQYKSFADLGGNVSPLAGNIIAISASPSFLIGGGAAAPGVSHNGPLWSVGDDFNWVKGSHQISFGGSIYHQQLNYWSAGGVNASGLANFDGSVTGLVLADFMLGRFSSWSQGTLYGFYSRQFYQALYIQDSWKITPRLTMNYGVRWEPYTSVYQKFPGQDAHFDPALFAAGVHSTVYQNAPAGMVFSGDKQYSCGDSFNCNKWAKFFPRVGLAWDPKGDGKMTIRAAYGMFGDRMSMLSLSQEQFGSPFGNLVSAAGGTLTNPWANYGGLPGVTGPGQNPLPTLATLQGLGHSAANIPFPTFGTYVTSPLTDFHPMYVNQWNLSIQRQIGQNWLLTANYLGTNTVHLPSGENINSSQLVPNTAGSPLGTCPTGVTVGCNSTTNQNQRRVLFLQDPNQGKYYAGVGQLDDGGTASYEGVYFSAQKRFSQGVTLLANYTWSHCISDPWNQNPTGAGVAIPNARRQWRSNCVGTDMRQIFSLNMVARTPKFASRAARILASDWQVAPILQVKSAQFFSVLAGPDRALSTVPGQPAQLLSNNPYPAHQSVDQWIDPAAFGQPALGTYGNLGLNNMKGPGVFQLNMALSRDFSIAEHKTLQVRAEAFNLPNHLNPFTPGITAINTTLFGGQVNVSAPNYWKITSDISGNNGQQIGDYRIVQFAMKFVF